MIIRTLTSKSNENVTKIGYTHVYCTVLGTAYKTCLYSIKFIGLVLKIIC